MLRSTGNNIKKSMENEMLWVSCAGSLFILVKSLEGRIVILTLLFIYVLFC